MTAVLVIVGAMVGAPARYLVERAVQRRHDTVFPWGTISVNLAGCLVLGVLSGAASAVSGPMFALLGTGFCGALTTYSTFSFDTFRLLERGSYFYAVMNIVVSVLVGIGAVALGYGTASSLAG